MNARWCHKILTDGPVKSAKHLGDAQRKSLRLGRPYFTLFISIYPLHLPRPVKGWRTLIILPIPLNSVTNPRTLIPTQRPFNPTPKILKGGLHIVHAHLISFRLGESLLYIKKTAKVLFPNAFAIPIHDLESKIDYGLYLFPTEFLAVIRESLKRFQKLVVGYQVVTRLSLHEHRYF